MVLASSNVIVSQFARWKVFLICCEPICWLQLITRITSVACVIVRCCFIIVHLTILAIIILFIINKICRHFFLQKINFQSWRSNF